MKSNTTIQLKNEFLKPVLIVKHAQNLDKDDYFEELLQQQQNYFLICESCFWMASTLSPLKSNNNLLPVRYTRCPLCDNKIDQFSIPSVLN